MKQLDFDRAFPQTPDCIPAAIEMGFRKGQKQMKMRNKIIAMGSVAAALMIMFAVTLATGGLSIAPKPDVLAQPPVTDIPKNEEAIYVYSTDGATFYHLKPDCSGMENAVEMGEIEAVRIGKQACPVCIPMTCNGHDGEEIEFVYYSQGAKHFHKQEECSGGSFDLKGKYFTVTRAFPGKEPCTTCFPNGIEECVHERAFVVEIEPMAAPIPEEYAAENESTTDSMPVAEEYVPMTVKEETSQIVTDVYYTEGGKYYHSNEHCQGMMNAKSHTRESARRDGKLPCPICLLVYAREGGTFFHLLPDCMGMLYADLYTQNEAYTMGNQRCPLCLSPETVYATKLGNYFHTVQDCSGMKGASATTPEAEWANGKTPCPVCITGDSMRTLDRNEIIPSRTAEQSEISIRLPEHHELFEKAFGKSINTLFPGCNFSFESWDVNDENADNRVWMLKNSADPNEEVFAGVGEYAPGTKGYDGYRLRVNLTDNLLDGNHVNNAHVFLQDAYFWKNGIQVSLRNLCNYAQLYIYIDDEIKKLQGAENRFCVAGVMVYFDENEDVCGYDVRYYYDGKDTYVLRTTFDADGTFYYEPLEGEVWK